MIPRADRVLIVASGPSVEGAPLHRVPSDVHIIAVNGAVIFCPRVDSFFSLDPSTQVRALLRSRRPGVAYYLAVPDDYGMPRARMESHRPPREAGVTFLRRVAGSDGPYGSKFGLADDPDAIHTGNSAYGALGLAWHMKPARVAILGVDGTNTGYAYLPGDPRPQFSHLAELFASTAPQLEAAGVSVRNGSPESVVTCWPRSSATVAIDWICSP